MPRPTTQAMADLAIGQASHELYALVEVCDVETRAPQISTDADQTEVPVMKVVDGSVTIDEARAVHGDSSISIMLDADSVPLILPTGPEHPLAPTSNRVIRISVGVRNPVTHEPEVTSLGYFGLTNVNVDEVGGGVRLTADLSDLWERVEESPFFRPRRIVKGTAYEDAMIGLIEHVLPFSEITVTPTAAVTPELTYDVEGSRIGAFRTLCAAVGYIARLDGDGDVVIEPFLDRPGDPTWIAATTQTTPDVGPEVTGATSRILRPADPNFYITRAKRNLSKEKTKNGIIARGESAGSSTKPVRAEAWDTREDSPFWFDPDRSDESLFGPRPAFITSNLFTSTNQCLRAARAELAKRLGMAERLVMECNPNPGMTPGDPMWVYRPSIGIFGGTYVIQAVTYPLTAESGKMGVTSRERILFPDDL